MTLPASRMTGPMTSLGPEWLAHRYDPPNDAVHLRLVDRETRARVPFLTDEELGGPGQPQVLRRADLAALRAQAGPVHFIFHSAYCCSTLLANVYDRPGSAYSLKEPVLLNDLVGWRHRGAPPSAIGPVLEQSLDLLARPWTPGEVGVIKPSNVVNGLAPAMLAARPGARAILLYAPLRIYLGSIAGKGLWGRRWVRDLLHKQLKEQLVVPGFTAEDYFLQTDLQIAAVGWLAQHALYARLTERFAGQVRTLDSERLLADPASSLGAIDALFEVTATGAERAALIARVFGRNAKTGDRFDTTDRRSDQAGAAAAHADEIAKVHDWALEVARTADIAMEVPAPLLD